MCMYRITGSLTVLLFYNCFAFSALMLLVGWREEHPACKKWVMKYWRGYLSRASWKWFAYGPANATATPSSLASLKSRMVLPFWCQLGVNRYSKFEELAFTVAGPSVCNSLPIDIHHIPNITIFKRHLKTDPFNRYSNTWALSHFMFHSGFIPWTSVICNGQFFVTSVD